MSEEMKCFLGVLFGLFLIITSATCFSVVRAGVEAKLYNDKFGTHYTTKDFYFSGMTIKRYLHSGVQSKLNLDVQSSDE